jgi:hypothetical protein
MSIIAKGALYSNAKTRVFEAEPPEVEGKRQGKRERWGLIE